MIIDEIDRVILQQKEAAEDRKIMRDNVNAYACRYCGEKLEDLKDFINDIF
jgi:hypothetical protein